MTGLLLARLLTIGGAALAFGWWQGSVAAGLALACSLWALSVLPR